MGANGGWCRRREGGGKRGVEEKRRTGERERERAKRKKKGKEGVGPSVRFGGADLTDDTTVEIECADSHSLLCLSSLSLSLFLRPLPLHLHPFPFLPFPTLLLPRVSLLSTPLTSLTSLFFVLQARCPPMARRVALTRAYLCPMQLITRAVEQYCPGSSLSSNADTNDRRERK